MTVGVLVWLACGLRPNDSKLEPFRNGSYDRVSLLSILVMVSRSPSKDIAEVGVTTMDNEQPLPPLYATFKALGPKGVKNKEPFSVKLVHHHVAVSL